MSAVRTKFQEVKALSDQGTETRFTSSAVLLVKAAFRFITLKRVDPSERERITARIKWMETSLTVAAIAVASLMAFLSLYQEKPFGSFGDYVAAFLWGFGFDASAKGFAPILNRLLGRKTP